MTNCPWPRRMSVRQMFRVILNRLETVMSALQDLQQADVNLKNEVATFLTDIAAALSANDPQIEQVVADINEQVAALQGGDPANAAPPAPPAA